jgi:hypothetical protein
MKVDTMIGLGPYRLVLPACNAGIAKMPPDDATWELIIATIELIRRHNYARALAGQEELVNPIWKLVSPIWTDGTWIP